jgi:hypothetical protein
VSIIGTGNALSSLGLTGKHRNRHQLHRGLHRGGWQPLRQDPEFAA